MKGLQPVKGVHPVRHQETKARLLAGMAPNLDVSPYADDIYQVNRGGPSVRPRIQTRDKGWVEIDRKAGVVRSYGKPGRAQALAAAVAESEGLVPVHQLPSGDVRRVGIGDGTTKRRYHDPETLVTWWRERGYEAVGAENGVWVDVGVSKLQDIGDQIRLHGTLTDQAAYAIALKAKEAWGGAAELSGEWSPPDRDTLWLAAQRAGIRLEGCTPSANAMARWAAEQASADSLAHVSSATKTADMLLKAASGDVGELRRLQGTSPRLAAFVSDYLDDDQRLEMSRMSVTDVIPELDRFRALGQQELGHPRTEDERIEAEHSQRFDDAFGPPGDMPEAPATGPIMP